MPKFYIVSCSLFGHAATRGTCAAPGSCLRHQELLGSAAEMLVEAGTRVLAEVRPLSPRLGNRANAEFAVCLTHFQQQRSLHHSRGRGQTSRRHTFFSLLLPCCCRGPAFLPGTLLSPETQASYCCRLFIIFDCEIL